MPQHVSSTCAHRQEVKIVLYSLWYHHTETSEWSKITKITKISKMLLLCAHIYIQGYRKRWTGFETAIT